MYIIFLQRSPWEKSVSFFPNCVMVLARPVELRNASASKVLRFFFPFARFFVFMAITLCHCDQRQAAYAERRRARFGCNGHTFGAQVVNSLRQRARGAPANVVDG